MKKQIAILTAVVLSFTTVLAQAHPGHDHHALISHAEHSVFFLSIVLLVVGIGYGAAMLKRRSNKK